MIEAPILLLDERLGCLSPAEREPLFNVFP
jgi:hypothetical protein